MTQTTTTGTPTIGAVIRAWRVFRGLRAKELAEKAGIQKGYLSAIEHDRKANPWLGNLKKLAAALEISLQDIDDRRLPPGQELQALFPPLPGMAQSLQPPAAAVAAGSVLQQILEQVQALTAAVAQLQADLTDLNHRVVILSLAQPRHSEGPARVTGEWKGYAWHYLRRGTHLTVKTKSGGPMWVPHDMIFLFSVELRLDSTDNARFSGSGILRLEFWLFGGEVAEPVELIHVSITGDMSEDGRISLTLRDFFEREAPWVGIEGTLSGDGRLIMGRYESEGLLAEQDVKGTFFLLRTEPSVVAVRDRDEGVPARET